MRKLLPFVLFILLTQSSLSQHLYPVEIDGEVGYIDTNGEVRIEAIYDTPVRDGSVRIGKKDYPARIIPDYAYFSEGRAVVKIREYFLKIIPWGFHYEVIDSNGNSLFETGEDEIYVYREGLAVRESRHETFAYESESVYGYVNTSGEWEILPIFTYASPFNNGVALVLYEDFFRFIDREGEFLHDGYFEDAYNYSEGLAPVKLDEKWGYIDRKGELVISSHFWQARQFSDGAAMVVPDSVSGKYRFINKNGEYINDSEYSAAWNFSEGRALVRIGDKYGYLAPDGSLAIEAKFEDAGTFSDGVAPVKISVSWGFIDQNGNIVCEPQFLMAGPFRSGLAPVWQEDGNMYYINKKWEIVHQATDR